MLGRKRILIGFNDLWTTHPEIAGLLKDPQRGYELTYGSGKKDIFICDYCGLEQPKIIKNVVNQGISCLKCSDGFSYPEKFFLSLLMQNDVRFETQKRFKGSNKRYDFYIKKLNAIIEINGSQHYRHTGFNRSLSEEQENDKIKKELAINNGIENYIIIDARNSELEYIKKNIIDSELNNLIDLTNINWNTCNEFASNNLLKTACDLWNRGVRSAPEIGKIMNINRSTARRYLKQGSKLDWCDYDPKQEPKIKSIKNLLISNEKLSKKIIQLSMESQTIKEWKSISEASLFYSIHTANIIKVCRGQRNHTGGYKWMYKEDYDQYIEENNLHILVN